MSQDIAMTLEVPDPIRMEARLAAVETKLDTLIDLLSDHRPAKEWYSPVEVAEILVPQITIGSP